MVEDFNSSSFEDRFYGSLPPLNSSDISESDYESDTGSLNGYYHKVSNNLHSDEELVFKQLDGRKVSFDTTSSTLSNQESLISTDTTYKFNEIHFNYRNLSSRHIKWEIIIIIVLLLGYAGKYFNSAHFYLIAQTWEDHILDIKLLKLLCVIVICFCFISKIILGTICDRYSISKEIFIITNIICGVSSLLFAIGTPGWWFFSAIILSISIPGTWVSLIGILAHWIPINRQGKIFSIFSSCFLLCNIISFICVEAVVYTSFSWQIYLIIVSCISICFSIPGLILLRTTPKQLSLQEPPTLQSSLNKKRPVSFIDVFKPLFRNLELILLSLLAFEIYGICQYFLVYSWEYAIYCYCSPEERVEAFNNCLSSNNAKLHAVLVSLLFPFFGIISSLIVGYLRDGISKKHRCVILTTFSLSFLIFISCMHLFINISTLPVAAIFIACCGLTILGPYSLLCGVFAVEVGGKYRSATVSGITDSFGFISETIVIGICYFYGSNSTQSFIIIIILTILTIITSIVLWKRDCTKRTNVLNNSSYIEQFYSQDDYDEEYDYSFIQSSSSLQINNNSFKN